MSEKPTDDLVEAVADAVRSFAIAAMRQDPNAIIWHAEALEIVDCDTGFLRREVTSQTCTISLKPLDGGKAP